MNNFNQNPCKCRTSPTESASIGSSEPNEPCNIQKFALRYLIKEHQEKNTSSWCSTNNEVITVRSKPMLQYTFDGVVWHNVPTVVDLVMEKE